MTMLVWIMIGIAVWHFTVWVPDRFWGGIVGAFLVAIVGSAVFGLLVSGLRVPADEVPGIDQALIAVPGAVIALAASYLYGARREDAADG